ncbi:MAG: glutamate 5-kinase [Nitrospiraceae bacterium]|jgi:glutamate 5-kinase|nr:MAG: glutamate 5-kinase [Nitrospiraceae bacterium]
MKRLVIKIGSNILATERSGLNLDTIQALSKDISHIASSGYEVVLVSSGSIAAGIKKLGLTRRPKDIRHKQAAAAVGQSNLMWAYERGFAKFGKKVAQVLLTTEDFCDRKRYINAKNTLLTLLSYDVIPIVNENDTVSTDEIKFGDNDNLASFVSILVEADQCIMLSDVKGLYDDDPRLNKNAVIIHHVDEITPDVEKMAGESKTLVGTGGMYSKVLAAKKATHHGIGVHIISGKKPGLLKGLIDGDKAGTYFEPKKQGLSHRKSWIAYSSRSKGSIAIDSGAVKALRKMGKSLLPSGIVSVEGSFEVGDAVYCLDPEGKRVAKGLMNYSSSDIKKIKGHKTSEIEAILGYKYSDEAIHRDNLVIL